MHQMHSITFHGIDAIVRYSLISFDFVAIVVNVVVVVVVVFDVVR